MKFKISSFILALFTLIGLGIFIYTEFDNYTDAAICILLYVFIPAFGAYGTWFKNRVAIFITLLFFVSQSFRTVDGDSAIAHIAPITISLPIGDFVNGKGYLIDLFAIGMSVFIGWLLKLTISPNRSTK